MHATSHARDGEHAHVARRFVRCAVTWGLRAQSVGGKVNIEVDVTAKYVEKSMSALLGRVEALEQQVAALTGAKQ